MQRLYRPKTLHSCLLFLLIPLAACSSTQETPVSSESAGLAKKLVDKATVHYREHRIDQAKRFAEEAMN